MDVNEIIKEINDSLTGDLKTDINYYITSLKQ